MHVLFILNNRITFHSSTIDKKNILSFTSRCRYYFVIKDLKEPSFKTFTNPGLLLK